MLKLHGEITRLAAIFMLSENLNKGEATFASIRELARTQQEKRVILDQLQSAANNSSNDFIMTAKVHYAMGQMLENKEQAQAYFDAAFGDISRAVARGLDSATKSIRDPHLSIQSDQVTWVMLPARFDFAGGWSDTPPVCLERGGCVLNASVTLNGHYPIQVIGKIRPDVFTVGINSIDLAQRETISSMQELRNFHNRAEWLSLPKAAFFASGIFNEDENGNLSSLLKKMGGGIDLTLFSALPSGSGLGTSSILGAGLIAALARMMGVNMPRQELYARTSYLEQLMTTGGGWQDHIGGVAGGVKLITSAPGYDQSPTISWTRFDQPGMVLNDHFLLYYTGYRRLAKNLLRQVVGNFLEQQPRTLKVLDDMAELAVSMKGDLDHRRFEAFGKKIDQSWQLNKALDRGQTTAEIEAILLRIKEYMFGAKLLGAGGGGFLFIAAKDPGAAALIRRDLIQNPPNDRARFFDFEMNTDGMRVTVL